MENKPLKSLVLPNSRGENVNYILHPDWENVENKPTEFPISWTLVNDRPNIMPGENDGIENDTSTSSGAYSVALGASTAQGDYSFAEGEYTWAKGRASHAEGKNTTTIGIASHAEGDSVTKFSSDIPTSSNEEIISAWQTQKFTLARAPGSHAEGKNTLALGTASHSEGINTIASLDGAHAEGYKTIASEDFAHAEGQETQANNVAAHAEGSFTIANGENSHVQGRYNLKDDDNKYAHIVGNGTAENARSNAHTLDWDGNAWYAGSLSATKLILTPESYGTSLPEDGVEGQIFFLIGGNNATEQDGIVTMGY